MLHVLYGDDNFSIHQALERLRGDIDDDLKEVNVTELDGARLTLGELRGVCDVAPFLSAQRLVIVRGLLSRFDAANSRRRRQTDRQAEAAKRDREAWQGLGPYVAEMPESTLLALVEGRLRENNPLLRTLKPLGQVLQFPALKGAALQEWVVKRVKELGGSISLTAARLLATLSGGDLWAMSNDIEKLVLYASGRRIEEREVRLLTSQGRDANIFALVDAAIAGRTGTALSMLRRMQEDGAALPYLVFMFVRQFRLLILAKEFVRQGLRPREMQSRLGLQGDWQLRRIREQERRFSGARLRDIYRRLLAADLAAKRGRGAQALDLLVVELGQRRA